MVAAGATVVVLWVTALEHAEVLVPLPCDGSSGMKLVARVSPSLYFWVELML